MTTEALTRIKNEENILAEQSLILPNKREKLLMKINALKVNNLNAKDKADYDVLVRKTGSTFVSLCWSKLGVSKEQLEKLEQQDLNELAAVIFEQSKTYAFVSTSILMCVPIIGWFILHESLMDVEMSENIYWCNMRYYWWYRRIKNKYGQNFEPSLGNR